MIKGVLPFKDTPLAAKDEAWDGGAEVKAATVDDLKEMCAWYDSANPDVKTSYKLPHHKAAGQHAVVWRGVANAMARLSQTDLPDADKKAVYNHLAKHYKQFDEEPPEMKSIVEDNTKELFVKSSYDPKQKLAIASTDVLDRQDERIDQDGWDLNQYMQNPVLLWAHDNYQPAVGSGRNIRVAQIGNGRKALLFEPTFHGQTELSRAMQVLYNGDGENQPVLNSFSVGFRPLEQEGDTYTKNELLEISCVNVPANPEAQMLAYEHLVSKGFSRNTAKEATGFSRKSAAKRKGEIQDAIDEEESWEAKCSAAEEVYEAWNAFCDVYYNPDTAVDDLPNLLTELAGIISKIAEAGMPSDDDMTNDKVLDSHRRISKDISSLRSLVKDKIPSAPKAKVLNKRQMMAKAISKASDIILSDRHETLSTGQHKILVKIIKRASEKLSASQKEEING